MPVVLIALIVLALAPATAGAQTADRSARLWATVNICDTAKNPDTLGVYASMPGSGKRGERMFMRFRAQYFSLRDELWHNFLSRGNDSGWVAVGSATSVATRSGWKFTFAPRSGQRYRLRGKVNFEWRRGDKVVRREVRRTRGGHPSSVGDPRRYSAATCEIAG